MLVVLQTKASMTSWESLVDTILLYVMLRISRYGVENNFIRPEQFGFRTKEECISLFISIHETCRRRQLEK